MVEDYACGYSSPMKTPSVFFVFITAMLALAVAELPVRTEPALLVRWDGAYLTRQTGGEKLDLPREVSIEDSTGQIVGMGFPGQAAPLSPVGGSYDSARPSAHFYGLLEMQNPMLATNADIASSLRSLNAVSANYGRNIINFACTSPVEGGTSFCRGLVYWRVQDSSLASAVSRGLGSGDLQSFSVEVAKINSKLSHFQFAVQSDGKWYLSETRGDSTGWTVLHDTVWAEWPVTAEFPLPPFPEAYSVSASKLQNITAVGLAFSVVSSSARSNAVFGIRSFYVELVSGTAK